MIIQQLSDEIRQEIIIGEKSATYNIYYDHELVTEIVSERPFRLGMISDGTTKNCLVAMLANLIKRNAIYFPSNLSPEFTEARKIGVKEGIVPPKKWGIGEKEMLKDDLLEYGLEKYAKHIV